MLDGCIPVHVSSHGKRLAEVEATELDVDVLLDKWTFAIRAFRHTMISTRSKPGEVR